MKSRQSSQSSMKTKGSKVWNDSLLKLHPIMKDIIKQHPSLNENYICIICSSGQLKNMLSHFEESKSHKKYMEQEGMLVINKEFVNAIKTGGNVLVSKTFSNSKIATEDSPNLENERAQHNIEQKELKMDISQFIVVQRFPYTLSAPLLNFVKKLLSKYSIGSLLDCSISRTTVSYIAKHCIGEVFKEDIYSELKCSPFSLSLDETSDKYGSSFLAICSKFLQKDNFLEPQTKLLCILPMDEGKTGKMLYKAIKNKVLKNDADLEKSFVGIVSDQAASMIGPYKGVAKRLKNDFPYIVATNDLSHIYHLITKHSVKFYPSQTLQIIKDLSNHFAKSCQRRAKFRSVQKKK